jgi:hypothetical protein
MPRYDIILKNDNPEKDIVALLKKEFCTIILIDKNNIIPNGVASVAKYKYHLLNLKSIFRYF